MRKHIAIAKLYFKAQLAYRADVVITAVLSVTKVMFAYVLWGAIFGARDVVAGFTLPAMLTYYVLSGFLGQLEAMTSSISDELSNRIRGGTFSKFMVIPTRPLGYFAAMTVGASAFYMIFSLLSAIAWKFVFGIDLVLTADPALWLEALAMTALGMAFMIQLNFFLGLLAFRWGEIWIFLMIKGNLVMLATGGLVPLALMPEAVIAVMRYLPFYYVTYLPSMLMIGRNAAEALPGLLTLAAWVAAFVPICAVAYDRMRIRYDGVGI